MDIIMFYNAVFLPAMKAVIYGFKEKSVSKKPVIHVDHCPLPMMPDMSSPRRVSQQHSIFVSPWRSSVAGASGARMHSKNFVPASPRQWLMINNQGWSQNSVDSLTAMTPMTKRLYSFGEEPNSPITMVSTLFIFSNIKRINLIILFLYSLELEVCLESVQLENWIFRTFPSPGLSNASFRIISIINAALY